MTVANDLGDLTKKLAEMDIVKFERWMKRNGYHGTAAVALARKRREAIAKNGEKQ